MSEIILAIVEDDPIVKESLHQFFEAAPLINFTATYLSVEDFLEHLDQELNTGINMVLLDIQLPGMSGLEGIAPIKSKLPNADIVMFTTYEEEEKIFDALCKGAISYISKRTSLAKLLDALLIIGRGGSYMSPSIARKVVQYFIPKKEVVKESVKLTTRQVEIVDSIVDGLSYKMVAEKLGISIETVRDHIKKIYKLLHINSKGELIRKKLEGDI